MSPIRLSSPQSNVDIGASSPFRWKARRRGSTGHSILCTIGAPEPVATLTLIAAVPPKSAVTSQGGMRMVSPETFGSPMPTPSRAHEAVSGLPPHSLTALPHLSRTVKRSSGVLPPSTRGCCGSPSDGATSLCGAPGPSASRVTSSCLVPAGSATLMLSVSLGFHSGSLKPDVSSKPTRRSAVTVVAPHRSASVGRFSSDTGTAGKSSKRPCLTVTSSRVPP
mmetsp:Transcript_42975/g.100824  ORF Transcript_42975/g.100824 Transcript_42975/m.100824 type:complete len:222 (-) Transcript_42975:390-1055(-)